MIILTGKADSYAQFITVLFIFVAVLAVTALVTKWIAGYQKQQGAAGNIEVRETVRIANNKYIQLVRIGESYFAIAVCKDTVTALGQIPAEQLKGSGLMIILTGKADSYAQFITVLFIFVAVLAVTALVTKWIAGYQKQQGAAGNIEVRETVRIANNKYIQLVRIGESYFAIAVCKDTVTALGQIPAEQLKGKTTLESTSGFRELLERAAKKENEEKDH